MNSLYQQLNQQQPQTTKSSQQPQTNDGFDLQQLVGQYPMLQAFLALRGPNQSYKDLFYMIAQQKGIDPQTIINKLMSKQP